MGFSLALGSAGADLLWRLREDSSGATAGLFIRDEIFLLAGAVSVC